MPHADDLPPSRWITRFAPLLHTLAPTQTPLRALDLACGSGRHTRWLLAQGCHVTAIDRDAAALAHLADRADQAGMTGLTCLEADLENAPWPLPGRTFDVVVVTNYLWRPLLPRIVESVAVGGVLLYETFAQGNQTVGRPARPDFLLAPGELLQVCTGLRVIAYEDGYLHTPPRFVQRIAAVRERPWPPDAPPRYPLDCPADSAPRAG